MNVFETISASIKESYGETTRATAYYWMRDEGLDLNQTPLSIRKVRTLARQMGSADWRTGDYVKLLDFILDELTKRLSPVEWQKNVELSKQETAVSADYRTGQIEVFAMFYSGVDKLTELRDAKS
jgi:hypothetical protein